MNRYNTAAAAIMLAAAALLSFGAHATPTSTGCGSINCFAWTGLTLNKYLIKCHGIIGGNATQNILLQFGEGAGPTWQTGASAYTYNHLGTNGTSQSNADGTASGIPGPFQPMTTGTIGADYESTLQNLADTTTNKVAMYKTVQLSTGGTSRSTFDGFGYFTGDTAAITAVRLIDTQGTPVSIASGSCSLYSISS